MKIPRPSDRKQEALRTSRTLNPRPDRVRCPLFQGGGFFEACDLLQVKYEMLRCVEVEGQSVRSSALQFGFSRVTWYKIHAYYARGGIVALLPGARGRKSHPKKLNRSRARVFVQMMFARNMNA